ncbi:hypothetical protein [Mesorhizobium tamadayense]|uniref:hypothetical protein n=1 Tax=Mesorhizobium tamadayense TaxID=425306 RepID=UPI00315DA88E
MAFLQPLRRDLAGGRAAGIGERRRTQLQRLRQCRCVDEALGEEEQREAGVDGCGFGRDCPGKCIWIGLICGERREAACVTRARTGQLAFSRNSSNAVFVRVFLCVFGTLASRASLPSIPVLAMGRLVRRAAVLP